MGNGTSKKMELPIIVVNLNNKKTVDNNRFPSVLNNYITVSIPFKAKIMQYALKNWRDSFHYYKNNNKADKYIYKDSVYSELGL